MCVRVALVILINAIVWSIPNGKFVGTFGVPYRMPSGYSDYGQTIGEWVPDRGHSYEG